MIPTPSDLVVKFKVNLPNALNWFKNLTASKASDPKEHFMLCSKCTLWHKF